MTRTLLALALGLALLAGCGGGDDKGGGGGGNAMSREDFVSEANKICRQGEEKINAKAQEAQQKIREAGSSEEAQQKAVADVLEETAKEYDPYLERLGDLEPPQELRADWDKFLAGVNDAFELIPDLAEATREGDRDKLSDLTTRFSQIAGDTRPFAQKYELDDCLPENSNASS
jgi:hypothetical protein